MNGAREQGSGGAGVGRIRTLGVEALRSGG